MNIELLIQHGKTLFQPAIEEGITWTTERKGCPSTLTFNVLKEATGDFVEGDAVRLKIDGQNVFYGFIFSKKRDKDKIITVTAYDQLRYLKNKDTYVYEGKTAGELIQMIANDFRLNTGSIENTEYKIPSRVEDNQTLFDIIQTALDLTLQVTGKMYVLYDDFGKLTLQSLGSMKTNILIDEETGQNFNYTSSIDDETFYKVKNIFSSIGVVEEIPENKMNEIIPVNGSMPAYLYYFVEAFIENAVNDGIEYEIAKTLACQAVIGSAKMILQTDKDIKQLITDVCSPGGATLAGLKVLEDEKFQDIIKKASQACIQRAYELS